MQNLAIIPARGGSKRIPDKNIIEFYGKPMIIRTLESARKSGMFSKIVVSTEDHRVKEIVKQFGYEVLDRPPELATDTASLIPVILHGIEVLEGDGYKFENVCVLMANCPIRDESDVRASGEAFNKIASHFMMSVFKYGMFYPFWALADSSDGMKPYFGQKFFNMRSQELPEVFCPSGAIRWVNVDAFKTVKHFYGPNLAPYVIPWYKAIDIDEPDDLIMAKMIVELMQLRPEFFK